MSSLPLFKFHHPTFSPRGGSLFTNTSFLFHPYQRKRPLRSRGCQNNFPPTHIQFMNPSFPFQNSLSKCSISLRGKIRPWGADFSLLDLLWRIIERRTQWNAIIAGWKTRSSRNSVKNVEHLLASSGNLQLWYAHGIGRGEKLHPGEAGWRVYRGTGHRAVR